MTALSKARQYVKHPARIYSFLAMRGFTDFVSDELHVRILFRAFFGYKLDLSNPKTFNEKLQWLKLYDRNREYTVMADKLASKAWASSRIGPQFVVPALASWGSAEEISLDDLPDQFVLKTNHDSGGVIVCRDKASFDLSAAKRVLSKNLSRNYYWYGREWPYKDIKPTVFAERYLPTGEDGDLPDFKVLCFDGIPRFIELHRGRASHHTQDWYDCDWNLLDMNQEYAEQSGRSYPKPDCLGEMLRLSGILSSGVPHLRVDWFVVHGRLYLGELTFFDGSGLTSFDDPSNDLLIGNYIRLPEKAM